MKNVALIIENYDAKLKKIENSNSKELSKLNESLKLSIYCLEELRLKIRMDDFQSKECEINFFKHQKPYVCGNIKYFNCLIIFHSEKPAVGIPKLKQHIYRNLGKLETKKKKNIGFFNYCKLEEISFDDKYFTRNNNQLHIFNNYKYVENDPQFSTSHDSWAAEVLAYDLLTLYLNKELNDLRQLKNNVIVEEVKPAILRDLSWTASKTDLIELIYALYFSGALRNGSTDIKKIIDICSELFNIDLGNYYKTYAQIKDRQKDSTKFLDKLKFNLIQKLDLENRDL